ncbi:MAG: gliding motility-associated C-terminal domain-containing protein [Saprospiraceae bacterium]|nr:gliding motility-associated C-terminal domain-containing protein [Candidatus Brachybacter algidus]
MANSVDINVTNIITPNNDGLNDVLRFNSQQIIKESELWIYNRWGSRIYHTKDYKNDWSGERFPGGTYYYVLKINDATYKSALTVDK